MKVSIITAILDSPEIAKRQLFYYNKMNLSNDVEVIFVDDGSNPPLSLSEHEINFNFTLYHTYDYRPWTQPTARNYGAKRAMGDYIICTDIDHIISSEVVAVARNPSHDVIRFSREAAVLDENGDFVQTAEELKRWGLIDRYLKRDFKLPPHGNSYIFRKDLYLELGGVSERYCGTGTYPNREELPLKQKLKPLWKSGKITIWDKPPKPIIYMMPNGKYCGDKDYNPFGFFHNTSRRNNKDKMREKKLKLKRGLKSNKQIRRERAARFEYSNSRA